MDRVHLTKRCFYCGTALTFAKKGKSHRRATEDHLTPVSAGGSNARTNKVKCCQSCNSKKGSLTLEEYRLVSEFRAGMLGKEILPIQRLQFWGEQNARELD